MNKTQQNTINKTLQPMDRIKWWEGPIAQGLALQLLAWCEAFGH